jgi:hypothetical protein
VRVVFFFLEIIIRESWVPTFVFWKLIFFIFGLI